MKLYCISTSTYYGWFRKDRALKSERQIRNKNYTALLDTKKEAVVKFRKEHPDVGYRKLTWMMVDRNVAYISESTVYRFLKGLDMLFMGCSGDKASKEYKNKPLYTLRVNIVVA